MMDRASYSVDVVVPCYNEQDVLPSTLPQLLDLMRTIRSDPRYGVAGFRILAVDDGSKDDTWAIIARFNAEHPEVSGVRLSRNFGHQKALVAGLSHSTADVAISIDADLQDDIAAIGRMLEAYVAGSDIALGVRTDRSSDSLFKRATANGFYTLLAFLGLTIVPNHADFRLMSRRALDALLAHGEANLFLRGLVPAVGFPVTLVPYQRQRRTAGVSKYPLRKMISLAIDGLTSFSSTPLRLVAILGLAVFGIAALLSIYVLALRLFAPQDTIPGWASTLLPVLALGGLQLLSSGILGEYIGKIYLEVKRRPRFIVGDVLAAGTSVAPRHDAAPQPEDHVET
jgi:polyisoprenyl-phosphate glycosyltransferase